MAVGLDTTAHPTNAANLFATVNGGGWTTITSPSFSTGAGPILFVAILDFESGSASTATAFSLANTSGLTWTKRPDQTSQLQGGSHDFFGAQIWTAFSAGGSLSSQTVTATLDASSPNGKGGLWVLVLNGVASTEAACIGNSAGFCDGSLGGVNQQISASLTPAATGSWIVLGLGQVNDSAVLTANSNTSAYDDTFQVGGAGDYFAFGRYKSSGTVATTTASSAVTVGSSVSDSWGFIAALEIKAPAPGAPVGFYSETSRPQAKRLPAPSPESFAPATTPAAITQPTWGYDARSYEIRPRPVVRPPHESVFAPVAPVVAGTPPTWGYGGGRPDTIRRRQLVDHSGEAPRPIANLSRPTVFPSTLVIAVSTTQVFLSDFAAAWSIQEGASGGTITAGTGTSATYTAPATPGTFHVLATVLGQTQSVVVTVVSAPANATIRLDSPFQLMDGFGCASGDSEPALITDALADLLYDQVKGIGFSIHRMGINPDISGPRHDPGDYATFAWDIWGHVKKAIARGAKVICGPWTPPVAIKDNGALIGGHLNSGSYTTWANSLASFVTLAAAQSPPVPIYAISPQNEPDFGTAHDSCLYSAAQMRDFIKSLGAAIAALPAAQRPLLFAPEPSDPTLLEGYLSTLEADPTAAGYTGIYATHQYGNATMPAATRAARPVWQTEMSGLSGGPEATYDPSITDGIAIAKWVHSAIANGNVTAWVWWRGIKEYHTGALPYTDPDNEALILTDGDLTPSPITQFSLTKRLYTIGHFAKWIRPGSRRYGIVGSLPANVSATAYQDPVGRMVVVVINENGTPASLTMSIGGGGSPSFLSQYVTSGTAIGSIYSAGNMERQGMVSASTGTFTATLPASSVTTFVDESLGASWEPVLIGKAPAPMPAPKSEATLTVGPPSQIVPLGMGWQPSQPDQVQPRRSLGPERPIAAQAPVQPAAPVIQVQTSLPDRPAPMKLPPRPDQVLPVGPAAQVVPLGMGWAPEAPDLQAAKVPSPDRSTSVLPPVQPAVLPVLSTVTAPDQLARPPRAKAEIATAPTQAFPLPIQPAVTQPDGLAHVRRPAASDTASAPTQPLALLPVQPQVLQPDLPGPTRRAATGEGVQAPTQPPVLPVLPAVQFERPASPLRRSSGETATAPVQPSALVVPPSGSLDGPATPRPRARADVAQAPTQPVPLPIQPQGAVHDAPLKPRPAVRAEVATAPFQPPPPPPAPTFYAFVNEIPRRAAKAFDSFIQVVLGLVRPPPPTGKPSIFISGVRDSISISGVRDSISISGVLGMPATNEPISIPCGATRVIRWTYRQQPTDAQAAIGQPGDPIPLNSTVQDIVFTATRFDSPAATPADLLSEKKLSRGEIAVVNPSAGPTDPHVGEADITVPSADSTGEEPGQFYYAMKVLFTDGTSDVPTISTYSLIDHPGR